ncbi:hypothetical protein AGLY_017658 [Aphis glycines]|uniref:Exonuclease domain-containing protein n=1 Tax=Aphis glycines TaxID=307491 RepID=A0A6G0SVD5_APHGL|nr:hypothetical protein AGLY_017658 [Aphis glycines]
MDRGIHQTMQQNNKQKPKNKIIIIDFEFCNYQRTDLIFISAAISQTHVKSEIIRLRGRPLIMSPNGRIRLMNNYSYIKTRDLLLKIFEKKPDQLQVILNELHLAMKSKTSNLTTSFLKNYLDFNNQNAIILLRNGNSDKNILQRLGFNTNIMLIMTAYDTDNNRVFYLKLIYFKSNEIILNHKLGYIIKNGRFLSLKETHDSICKTMI